MSTSFRGWVVLPSFVAVCLTLTAPISGKAQNTEPVAINQAPGTTIVLSPRSDPAASSNFVWTKDKRLLVLEAADRVFFPTNAGVIYLVIMNCGPEDKGLYECWLGGEVREAWQVDVQPIEGNITGKEGQTVMMYCSDDPFDSYKWYRDDEELYDEAGHILGSTSNQLTIMDLRLSDKGRYTMRTRYDPVRENAVWNLDVTEIITPPQIRNFLCTYSGDDVTFRVDAEGKYLSYQWYWQGQIIEGATTNTLEYKNAATNANAGYYNVTVWNSAGAVSSPPPGLLFTKPVIPGTYKGIFQGNDFDTTGFFTFTLSQTTRSYSGAIVIGSHRYPFSGTFTKDHKASKKLSTAKGPTGLTLQLLSVNKRPAVTGTIYFGDRAVPCRGYQAAYSSRNPAPQAGKYTLAFSNPYPVELGKDPNGNGFASVRVDKSGNVQLSGVTADGATFSYSRALLSKDGHWPLYVPLYKDRGYMVGWLTITNQSCNSIPGEISWLKTPFNAKYYPGGFSFKLETIGSTYTTVEIPRVAQAPLVAAMIPFTKGTATFTGGDMFLDDQAVWDFVKVYVPVPRTIEAQCGSWKLSVDIKADNGTISGTFMNYVGRTIPLRGILMQQQGGALGYFISKNLSGYFALEGNP